jgi:hypothetical protein
MKAREEIQAVIDHGRKEGERVVAASTLRGPEAGLHMLFSRVRAMEESLVRLAEWIDRLEEKDPVRTADERPT